MSSILYYVELNGFAMAILVIMFLNIRRQSSQYGLDQKLFLTLIANVVVLLVTGTIVRTLSGQPGAHVQHLSIPMLVVYNSLNPTVCLIWACYVDYYIYRNVERIKRLALLAGIPAIVNAILSVASAFTDIYYVYDAGNVYRRGPYVVILLAICFVIVFYTTIFLIRNRRRIGRNEYSNMLLFALFPMVSGFIQVLVPGLDLIWIAATVSILMIFINIQKEQLHTDYLTDLYNRRYLDNYLQSIMQNGRGTLVCGIMIDIDNFKLINDVYGHDVGDQALKYVAGILKETFKKTDFVARYGGDEFLVVMEVANRAEIEALVRRLKENVAAYNLQRTTPYKITLSIGCACYDEALDASMAAFLKRLDALMYADKQLHDWPASARA